MKLCLLHSKPIILTLLPKFAFVFQYSIYVLICVSTKHNDWTKAICLFSFTRQVDYAIWAAQKAVTKAKYEWEQAFTLMKELKLKPPLLTFRAWIWATGTVQIIAQDKIPQTSRNICYLCKHFLVR
ncbi:hypothetical protein ERO13_A07G145950v2 [Gossypium hirsutum]|uniref:Protein SET DOMAIN GROUP 40-like n=2 Tax=Gossypium TaxID=3633 RepID=A0A5D2PTD0_GOSTO|nr:hypothetical protein ERO13_A07G145950v2 [Gossypium hirsutum]TYH10333.1 hypothetical protein ES288_A07G169900v1 [Gossypium darwinii]TYI19511.1 hypothetical protein ES332_A07G169600v1 [Gossypium tomentosum]